MKNKLHTKNTKGFSLIEILLYISLATILLTAMTGFIFAMYQVQIKNQTTSEVEQQGTQIMQLITQTIRNSKSIITPVFGGTDSTLSLTTSVPANNPTLFSLSSGNLRVTEGVVAPVNLNSNRITVSAFTAQNLSRSGTRGAIRIQFTLTYLNPGNIKVFNYNKTFTDTADIR